MKGLPRAGARLRQWRNLLIGLLLLAILTLSLVGPIDRTPLPQQPFYQEMMHVLDTMNVPRTAHDQLLGDWARVSITPDHSMPMAGYRPRDGFDSVHDSLFARVLAIGNREAMAVLVNVDLLLFPPALKQSLAEALQRKGLGHYFLYLGATHTHNGVGGWDESWLGQRVLGAYDATWVEQVTDQIAEAIVKLNPVPITFRPWHADASEWVENRIALDRGEKDGLLRGMVLEKKTGPRALFFTFSAHATSISKKSRALSADYPAAVIRQAENEFDFGMYMAGMVGSHRMVWSPEPEFEYMERVGASLFEKIRQRKEGYTTDSAAVAAWRVPIRFGPSQLRIAANWKVRDWVFRLLLRPLEGELTFLQLGNWTLVGTPCDFSGEVYVRQGLRAFEEKHKQPLVITSFNGDYAGYITYDDHYDSLKKEELRAMNWVGPFYGAYFADMIIKALE